MALKKLPGGVVVETTAGARLNEEAGVNLEAIHRQIIAGAPVTEAARAEADRAKAEADRAAASAGMIPLGGTVDVDTLRASQARSVTTADELKSPNLPWNDEKHVIIVRGNAAGDIVTQEAQKLTGASRDRAWRGRWAGAWTPWYYVSASTISTSPLRSGTSFDTLREPKWWAVQFTSHPGQPAPNVGTLEVLPASGLTMQRFTTWEAAPRTFVRRAINSTRWGAWALASSPADFETLLAGMAGLGVSTVKETLARNECPDPLFKGNGWTGWLGRQTWTVSDGVATVTTNVETGIANPIFEGVASTDLAARTKDGDVWSMSVVVGVPADAPGPLTLRAGVGYGPSSPTSVTATDEQTVAPGESKTFTVQNNATPAGRTTAFVTVRSGQVIPAGSVMTVSKPVLTKGPTVGEFFHGDMPANGETRYEWEGAPHTSASVKFRYVTSATGVLEFVRDPATGDLSSGSETIITDRNAGRLLTGTSPTPRSGARGALEARPATVTPGPSSGTPGALSADRTRVYTAFANPPRYSDDDGVTWTDLTLIPGGVSMESTLLLDDGEMLVTGLVGSINRRRVWRSEGLATGSPTWTQVLEAPHAGIKFTQAWSQSTHGRIVLINEYGPKAGMPWPGITGDANGNVPRGEAAVRTHLSLDYGRTFKVIFNLHDWVTTKGGRTNSDMQHLHGVAWDPYWDRIWITYGDGMGGKGSNGVIYSDDLGASWHFAHHTPEGSTSAFQCVGILPMPRCVLMFGDTTPAVMRINRTHGKRTGTYTVDVAYNSNSVGSPKHLCQGFYRGRREGDDAPALAAFSTEGGVGQDFIVATLDGYRFTEVWRGAPTTPAGWGVRNPVGPTIRGQFLAATNADGGTTGQWATIRIQATGY